MNILEVKNLHKTYGAGAKKVHAVNNVSFSIRKGEIFGLLGPNGAGKSTTINILSGLLTKDSGTIRIFGCSFDDETAIEFIKQNMNVASAYFGLVDALTVYENLKVYGMLYGVKNYKEKIDALMRQFNITGLRNKRTFFLSSGERTRLALCKGLINDPQLILLDECTVGLDPEIAEATRELLLEYQENHELSILFTSHFMHEVEELCDRIGFMSAGRLVHLDTAENLKKRIIKQTIRLHVHGTQQHLLAHLHKKGISVSDIDSHSVTFELPTTASLPSLLKEIFTRGITLRDIHVQRPTLDDVFIHLARKGGKQ